MARLLAFVFNGWFFAALFWGLWLSSLYLNEKGKNKQKDNKIEEHNHLAVR